jgi:hypothetical protein
VGTGLVFEILGQLEARLRGPLVLVGGTRQRALLLYPANRVVAYDQLVEELPGDQPLGSDAVGVVFPSNAKVTSLRDHAWLGWLHFNRAGTSKNVRMVTDIPSILRRVNGDGMAWPQHSKMPMLS